MIVARVVKNIYADLTGEGPKILGGRWNSPGRPVVYTGSCGALATLEFSVHIGNVVPRHLKLLLIEVPDTLAYEEVRSIPTSSAAFRQHGDEWLEERKTPLLYVPSVLAPGQRNILINPLHPDATSIKIKQEMPFVLDSRLLSSSF